MQQATGWMLERLDVEDDAREQIQTRLDSAFDKLLPLIEDHRSGREAWVESLLGADGIDRDGLEAQRLETLAAADRASQILSVAIADIAELLTPDQPGHVRIEEEVGSLFSV